MSHAHLKKMCQNPLSNEMKGQLPVTESSEACSASTKCHYRLCPSSLEVVNEELHCTRDINPFPHDSFLTMYEHTKAFPLNIQKCVCTSQRSASLQLAMIIYTSWSQSFHPIFCLWNWKVESLRLSHVMIKLPKTTHTPVESVEQNNSIHMDWLFHSYRVTSSGWRVRR